MKICGGVEYVPTILYLDTRCRWLASNRPHGTPWIGGLEDPGASLDSVENRKVLSVPRLEPRPSSPQRVAVRTDLCRLIFMFSGLCKPKILFYFQPYCWISPQFHSRSSILYLFSTFQCPHVSHPSWHTGSLNCACRMSSSCHEVRSPSWSSHSVRVCCSLSPCKLSFSAWKGKFTNTLTELRNSFPLHI
jgi:hypothetical protein